MNNRLYYEDQERKFTVCNSNPWHYSQSNIVDIFDNEMVERFYNDIQSPTTNLRLSALEALLNISKADVAVFDEIIFSSRQHVTEAITNAMQFTDIKTKRMVLRLIADYSVYEGQSWGKHLVENDLFTIPFIYFDMEQVEVHTYHSILRILNNWACEARGVHGWWSYMEDSGVLLSKLKHRMVLHLNALMDVDEAEDSDVEVNELVDDTKESQNAESDATSRDPESGHETIRDMMDLFEYLAGVYKTFLLCCNADDDYARHIVKMFVEDISSCCWIDRTTIFEEMMQGISKFNNFAKLSQRSLTRIVNRFLLIPFKSDFHPSCKVRVIKLLIHMCKNWDSCSDCSLSDVINERTWLYLCKYTPAEVVAMEKREIYQRLILGGLVSLMKNYYLATTQVSLGAVEYSLKVLDAQVRPRGVSALTLSFLSTIAIHGDEKQVNSLIEQNVKSLLEQFKGKLNNHLDNELEQAIYRMSEM